MLLGTTLAMEQMELEYVEPTADPVPDKTVRVAFTMIVREVVDVTTLGIGFGGYQSWLAADSGFHGAEFAGGEPLRWTNGNATLDIPVLGGAANALQVDLAAAAPGGSDLDILIDGEKVADVRVPQEGWSGTFDLPNVAETVRVQLISDTFVPSEVTPGSADHRELGVHVRAIRLLGARDT
jgi:hypothetical protein